MRRLIVVFPMVCLFGWALAVAQDVNVSGDWRMVIHGKRATVKYTVTFWQVKQEIFVSMLGPRGEFKGKGKIAGNHIEWTIERETPRGTITIKYRGTVEDDTMKGEADYGGLAKQPWEATRIKDKS